MTEEHHCGQVVSGITVCAYWRLDLACWLDAVAAGRARLVGGSDGEQMRNYEISRSRRARPSLF